MKLKLLVRTMTLLSLIRRKKVVTGSQDEGKRRLVPSLLLVIPFSNSSFYLPVCMLYPNLGTR